MTKRQRGYDPRIGKLLFILPAVVILVIGVYAFVALNSPGKLVVLAETNGNSLQVPVSVNGHSYTTPVTLSLAQGDYTVTFGTLPYYYPPSARDAAVTPGNTAYATGDYVPQTFFVQTTSAGFNSTALVVLHGLNPVTWTNPSSSLVTFTGGPFQQVNLDPGKSYTYVFPNIGNYEFGITSSNLTMTIEVK